MYCANNPIMHTDSYGTNFWHDVWNGIKQVWDVIVGVVVSTACVVGGVLLTIGSGGTLGKIGFGLIGAGVGGLLGGIQSKENGNSFWSGYLGGFVTGAFTAGFGAFLGPIGAFFGGAVGNFSGTIITDAINGIDVTNPNYLLNLTGDSLLLGLINLGSWIFGDASIILNSLGFKEVFTIFTIWSEFAFSALFEGAKKNLKDLISAFREKLIL